MAKKKYGTQSKGDADPDYVEEEIKSGSSGGYVKKLRKKRRKKRKNPNWNKQYGDNISGQGVSGEGGGGESN